MPVSNKYHDLFKSNIDNLIFDIVSECSKIHSFDAKETYNKIISIDNTNNINNINKNNNIDNTNVIETKIPAEPVKRKRGRPKKEKTETVSNSYVTGKEDPIIQKLLSAMKVDTKQHEQIIDDELIEEKFVQQEDRSEEQTINPDDNVKNTSEEEQEEDDGDFDTTFITFKGIEYLLAKDNTVYENFGENNLVGTWDSATNTIISA